MRADAAEEPSGPAPASIRELTFIDRLNEVKDRPVDPYGVVEMIDLREPGADESSQ